MKGWIGVDLDGTLAHYDGWVSVEHIGPPVPLMLARVKAWLANGQDVRIFTARVFYDSRADTGTVRDYAEAQLAKWRERRTQADRAERVIRDWCLLHIGQEVPITCVKDFAMMQIWDDRAVQIVPNTGQRADGQEATLVSSAPAVPEGA